MNKEQILKELNELEKNIERTWDRTNSFAYMCKESTYRFDGVRRHFAELKKTASNVRKAVEKIEE